MMSELSFHQRHQLKWVQDLDTVIDDYIRTGWRNILDCILKLHKLGLLPAQVASDAADESETSADALHGKPVAGSLSGSHMPAVATPRRSSGLMSRFDQWLSLDTEEPRSQRTEQQLAVHQRTFQTIQKRHIQLLQAPHFANGIRQKHTPPASLLPHTPLLRRIFIWKKSRCDKLTERWPHFRAKQPHEKKAIFHCLQYYASKFQQSGMQNCWESISFNQ